MYYSRRASALLQGSPNTDKNTPTKRIIGMWKGVEIVHDPVNTSGGSLQFEIASSRRAVY